MIAKNRVLAIIPARGGSKGVPRKNIRDLAGKPLIAWSIEEAKKSKYIDQLILSSEDSEIIEVAKKWGCDIPFVRPAELAQDDTPGMAPVMHALDMLPDFEVVVVLQATSPLRIVNDIDGCIEQCISRGANACVSVTEADQSPYWMYSVNVDGKMQPLIPIENAYMRRQDLPKAYILNGAVYVADINWLREQKTFLTEQTLGFVMPQDRSMDIDTEFDLELANIKILASKGKSA